MKKDKIIPYTVDGEPQETTEKVLTPTQILQIAEIDVTTHYLVQIVGKTQKSYKDDPDDGIHMHPKMEFLSIFNSATPVAYGGDYNYG